MYLYIYDGATSQSATFKFETHGGFFNVTAMQTLVDIGWWCGWGAFAKMKFGNSNLWWVEMPALGGGSHHEFDFSCCFFPDVSLTNPPQNDLTTLSSCSQDVQFLLLEKKHPKLSKVCESFEMATWMRRNKFKSSWLNEFPHPKYLVVKENPGKKMVAVLLFVFWTVCWKLWNRLCLGKRSETFMMAAGSQFGRICIG